MAVTTTTALLLLPSLEALPRLDEGKAIQFCGGIDEAGRGPVLGILVEIVYKKVILYIL